MDTKNIIIIIESVLLVILVGFLIYGYNQYSTLNVNYNDIRTEFSTLNVDYNNLKTEFESLTDFGTSKIKLPIDSNDEAVLVALNSEEYRNFYDEITYQRKSVPELLSLVINVPQSVLDYSKQKEAYNWIPAEIKSLYIIKIVEKPVGSNSVSDFVFNIYIDAETGNIIKAESMEYYAGLS